MCVIIMSCSYVLILELSFTQHVSSGCMQAFQSSSFEENLVFFQFSAIDLGHLYPAYPVVFFSLFFPSQLVPESSIQRTSIHERSMINGNVILFFEYIYLYMSDLEPPCQRPETSARTAKRLIAQGMGIKLPSASFGSKELRKQEEEARKNRIVSRQTLRDDAWGADDVK